MGGVGTPSLQVGWGCGRVGAQGLLRSMKNRPRYASVLVRGASGGYDEGADGIESDYCWMTVPADGGTMDRENQRSGWGRALGQRARVVLCGVGLACWIVTLTLHSATITPFQRFDGLSSFVGTFAPDVLGMSTVVAGVVSLFALRGRFLPGRVLWGVGAAFYVVTGVGFALLSLQGIEGLPTLLIGLFAVVGSVGSVAMGLVWGRVFKGFGARLSLASVGIAGVAAAVLGTAIACLPGVPCAALFILAVVAAVSLPLVCGIGAPQADVDVLGGDAPAPRSVGERLRSFADVAAPALIGLLAFAFVTGTMRALVIETHPFHLASLAIDGAVLVALALARLKRPVAGLAYRSLIPALAVLLLAVTNISTALFGGSAADMVMIYLLYTLAALLTLATLSAVAHAGEFPSDFVYGMPFALFCLASFVGLQCAEVMTSEVIKVSTTVITTVYAFAMVVVPSVRAQRLESTEPLLEEGPPLEAGVQRASAPFDGVGVPTQPGVSTIEERCAELVRAHHLTAREAEILAYLATGYGSGYISEALYISPNTVRTHIHNIYGKLGVNSREEVLDLVRD